MRTHAKTALALAALIGLGLVASVWVEGIAPEPGPDSAWPSQAELDEIHGEQSCATLVIQRDALAFAAMQAIGRNDHAIANHEGTLANEADARLRTLGCNPDGSPRIRGGTTTSLP